MSDSSNTTLYDGNLGSGTTINFTPAADGDVTLNISGEEGESAQIGVDIKVFDSNQDQIIWSLAPGDGNRSVTLSDLNGGEEYSVNIQPYNPWQGRSTAIEITLDFQDDNASNVGDGDHSGSASGSPEPTLEVTFDEGVEDSSSNGFPVQAVGTRLAEDRFGIPDHAVQLNGSSDFVDLPEAAFNAVEGTISIWVNPDDQSSGSSQIFSSADFSSPSGSRLYLHFDSDQGVSGSFLNQRFDHVNVSFDQWTHLALTWSDDVARFYVDGVLSETTSGGRPAIERVTLGAYGEGYNSFFNGKLDDFKAFGEVLSDNEIAMLADAGPDGPSTPDYGLISEPTPVSEDYEQIIDDRFGVEAQLADWETLSERYEEEGGAFLRESGLVPTGEDGLHGGAVTVGGERFWSGDRHYLARWGEVSSSFLSHDSVSHDGVPLHLGS